MMRVLVQELFPTACVRVSVVEAPAQDVLVSRDFWPIIEGADRMTQYTQDMQRACHRIEAGL